MARQVDFQAIVPRMGSQDESFEELCCQVARRTPDLPNGSSFTRYRGAGGDGGVECVWRLPCGDEWGWQAKFIFDIDRALRKLSESLDTALAIHGNLCKYTVCLPFDLTGPRNGRGKSGEEKFNVWKEQKIQEALANGRSLTIEIETSSALFGRLLEIDPSGGNIRFWFDKDILGTDWFQRHVQELIASAGPRYSPAFTIETPVVQILEALCGTNAWQDAANVQLKLLIKDNREWERNLEERSATWGTPFPTALLEGSKSAGDELGRIVEALKQAHESRDWSGSEELRRLVVRATESFSELVELLRIDLEKEHGEGSADSASFRQFQAEYQATFPTMHYDKAKEIQEALEELKSWLLSDLTVAARSQAIVIKGDAGVGKTHALCDAAERRLARGLLSVIVVAESLPGNGDPLNNMRVHLGLPDMSRDEFLGLFETAAETTGSPMLLAIDALNDTKPRSYWNTQLPRLCEQLKRSPLLRLCVSCRTTYIDLVVPSGLDIPILEHRGFKGMELGACKSFCGYYGLKPPITPFLHREFSNGLFLRLLCEATRALGLAEFPKGAYGFSEAVRLFLRSKNAAYARTTGSDQSHRQPERALRALVGSMTERGLPSLGFLNAAAIAKGIDDNRDAPLLEWMIDEGLLRVDRTDVSMEGEEHVFVSFERLGDYLLAADYLDRLDRGAVKGAFDEGGALSDVVQEDSLWQFEGVLEAMAILVPEELGLEIAELSTDPGMRDWLRKITVRTLAWRSPASITADTAEALLEEMDGSTRQRFVALNEQLLISTSPSSLDAYWLHEHLSGSTMPDRDEFWCPFLHFSFEQDRSVKRMIDLAFEAEPTTLDSDTLVRWRSAFFGSVPPPTGECVIRLPRPWFVWPRTTR